jgi:hypothetical protein
MRDLVISEAKLAPGNEAQSLLRVQIKTISERTTTTPLHQATCRISIEMRDLVAKGGKLS